MSKRTPLAVVPNAVNSPFRVAGSNGKRTRTQVGDGRESLQGQPPAKKQIIEISDDDAENIDPRRRDGIAVATQRKLEGSMGKRNIDKPPTAFEQKLAAAREKKPVQQQQRAEALPKANVDNYDTVRQWKRHYKRQFPQFVFYFESVTEEVRSRTLRQIQSLGAREEKFFSKAVTHVVTTRPIPPELQKTSPTDDLSLGSGTSKATQPSTLTQDSRRTTNLLDATLQRRSQLHITQASNDVDSRKTQGPAVDILTRARQLNIKIWALEKLQRVLKTMLEVDTAESVPPQDARVSTTVTKATTKPSKAADLEQLLRNEKINGPADRDMTVTAQDMVALGGNYLYIHDMNEQYKPTMVREYPKVEAKEEGKWPQFRLTPIGRCPFIEDPAHTKKLQQAEKAARAAAEAEQQRMLQRKTRGASATPQPLAECEANLRRSPRKATQAQTELSKPLAPPKTIPTKRQSSAEGMPALFAHINPSSRALPRMIGGEPMASGLQQSNVTSAIRSQAITSATLSSTAPGLNKRVGDSKEVSALKRKVLERGASLTSNQSMPTSYANDVRAAINYDHDPPPRAAKRRAQETLGVVHEDYEETADVHRATHRKPPAPSKRKPAAQKEPKPGYCENCRDKFDDFDDVSLLQVVLVVLEAVTDWYCSMLTLVNIANSLLHRTTGKSLMSC